MMKLRTLILMVLLCVTSMAQANEKGDSLRSLIQDLTYDSTWHANVDKYVRVLRSEQKYDSMLIWSRRAVNHPQSLVFKARALGYIAQCHAGLDNADSTRFYFQLALKAARRSRDKNTIGIIFSWYADFFSEKYSSVDSSRKYLNEAAVMFEISNETIKVGNCYNQIAKTYFYEENLAQSTKYLRKAYEIYGRDTTQEARECQISTRCNLALLITASGDSVRGYEEMLGAYNQALEAKYTNAIHSTCINLLGYVDRIQDYKAGFEFARVGKSIPSEDVNITSKIYLHSAIGLFYQNIMKVQPLLGGESDLPSRSAAKDSSLFYYHKGLQLAEEAHNDYMLALLSGGVAEVYRESGETEKGLAMAQKSYELYKSVGRLNVRPGAVGIRSEFLADMGQYEQAYNDLKFAKHLADSLDKVTNAAEMVRKTVQFSYEKEMLALAQEKQLVEEKQSRERLILRITIGGVLLLVLVILLVFYRFRRSRARNKLIFAQKEALSEVHRKVADGVDAAKLIQASILPSDEQVSEVFGNSFVFYRPKHVVSGDFYYVSQLQNLKLVVVADCTGHGVPGALMSAIGNAMLKRIIEEGNVKNAADILKKVGDLFGDYLENTEHDLTDGMVLSLCLVDEENAKVHFAAAENSLMMVSHRDKIDLTYKGNTSDLLPRREVAGLQVYHIDGDPFSIGFGQKPGEVINYEFNYEKGDRIFLYTDGIIDQKGGDKNKKLYRSRMVELLVDQNEKMNDKGARLSSALDQWMGDTRQIDDICVIGIEL